MLYTCADHELISHGVGRQVAVATNNSVSKSGIAINGGGFPPYGNRSFDRARSSALTNQQRSGHLLSLVLTKSGAR
jgi:hypothetical protein